MAVMEYSGLVILVIAVYSGGFWILEVLMVANEGMLLLIENFLKYNF